MRYVGGKTRIAKELTPFILAAAKKAGTSTIIEPFCGGLGMTCALVKASPFVRVEASDYAPGLITLYRSIRAGWKPPTDLDKAQWAELKKRAGEDHRLVAFAGFGCSFNGIYFCGYGTEKFPGQAARGLRKKLDICTPKRVTLESRSYADIEVTGPCVIYCDPPYRGCDRDSYRALHGTPHERFDSDAFWEWARVCADKGAHVLVSEYVGPDWARVLWQREIVSMTGNHNGKGDKATERLFYVAP